MPLPQPSAASEVEIDIGAIKARLHSDARIRASIANDFGLESISPDPDQFASDVLERLGQRPAVNPSEQVLDNSQVFRAAVRALGSNQRRWSSYLKNEAAITEVLCNFDPVEAEKHARAGDIAQLLTGQSSGADSRAMMGWARLLAGETNYYQTIRHLGAAFRSLARHSSDEPIPDSELLLCIVGLIGNPPSRWAGVPYLELTVRSLATCHWKTNGMSYILASEFMRNLGWNGFKPDRHVVRLFSRWLPDHDQFVAVRVHRLQELIGCFAKPLRTYLTYSLVGALVAPKNLALSQVDNLVWLLGAYVEKKGQESTHQYITTRQVAIQGEPALA